MAKRVFNHRQVQAESRRMIKAIAGRAARNGDYTVSGQDGTLYAYAAGGRLLGRMERGTWEALAPALAALVEGES